VNSGKLCDAESDIWRIPTATVETMTVLRRWLDVLMAKGGLNAAWYAIWTGVVLLSVALLLASASGIDPVAPYAAVVAAGLGLWQLVSGVRAQVRDLRSRGG
jgi:hypothetical protein